MPFKVRSVLDVLSTVITEVEAMLRMDFNHMVFDTLDRPEVLFAVVASVEYWYRGTV